jgi:glutamate synthase domain-containing protein 2/glutamate synthase domain-containing protein 1/glutamate synthase domain-containing protein 3
MNTTGLPPRQGLYDPQTEREACGIGFVASIRGRRSHDIIQKGLQVLINLEHRGACGCDPETGDGAGVLIQIPHEFFGVECARLGVELPEPGQYGVGVIFTPVEHPRRLRSEGLVERIIEEEGQAVLGWRDVPVDNSVLGFVAKASEPFITQVFIGRAPGLEQAAFERKLYVIRKRIENVAASAGMEEARALYVPSMSSVTVVYKGLLMARQITRFYRDLSDPAVVSALALVHQRFSTNTFPTWALAHPYRYLGHNGEINTLRGNVAWMKAREGVLASPLFGEDITKLFPVCSMERSDSANLDHAVELLVQAGRSLPHAMMMLVPEAWAGNPHMKAEKRAFYEYHASLMEPWDGPAAIAFTDGRLIGAILDRNGLRPARYLVTHDGLVVMASETGVLPVAPGEIRHKGRLQPGKMFLVDTAAGRIIDDKELKAEMSARRPYAEWLAEHQITLEALPEPARMREPDHETILRRQRAFGYTSEDLKFILAPMAASGEEPIGSMGTDTPLAVLSDKPQPLFNYFKQFFAQVTNPPIDHIREEMVMSLTSFIGNERNLLDETPKHCHTLKLPHPILTNRDLEKLRNVMQGDFLATTLPMLFRPAAAGSGGHPDLAADLAEALDELCARAADAVKRGFTLIVLSDRGINDERAPIPSLLALSAAHHHLIRESLRTQVALVVESGEPREVMHYALLIGYGASAINPYLAIETLADMAARDLLPGDLTPDQAVAQYIKAINKGLLKVFSKMGISTLQSYRGAQIFEAIGLNSAVVERYFSGTPSRIEGAGLEVIAREARLRHEHAFRPLSRNEPDLEAGGQYQWRRDGEHHLYNPESIAKLQHATRQNSAEVFRGYCRAIDEQSERLSTLRGLMKFRPRAPVPLGEVEPAAEIVKRFSTGAMSFGSISKEAHETLAIAMNRIGGRSNTGEGGEDEARFLPDPNGDRRRSAIKQVASGRFGVTSNYLVNADEIQIKMAQGAKPGEGGQLPGHKVDEIIARTRYSIPGVGLISPPPHHDIYSIEDLAQLIFDLKNVNPKARISVKLVAEVGVGTVAAGVAKAHADLVLISGHDGGTGASPLTSMKHAGIPWELGLAETQQVLVMNDLRGRIKVQVDGKVQTARDVVIAALLGAEEFGFATAPLVVLGCVMMRKCHLNTCPAGIATQDPVLRARFAGRPEHVVNYFFLLAEQVRELMAQLGFRRFDEMVGRVDALETRQAVDHWKAKGLDFSAILHQPVVPRRVSRRSVRAQEHGLEKALDRKLLGLAKEALGGHGTVDIRLPVRNVHRAVGAMLGGEISRRYGSRGLPPGTIRCHFTGSGGQSFGAFSVNGMTLTLEGDANDYVGKGISGGRLVIFPPRDSNFRPEENVIVGNTCLYGATGGQAFISGMAGERFAVRNSGATAVVEGLGDHGCEYMTRGLVVVLGRAGRNFGAGMSGGLAYVLDERGDFRERRVNPAMVGLESVAAPEDVERLRSLIERHLEHTRSPKAEQVLTHWEQMLPRFIKVMPHEYRRVLEKQQEKALEAAAEMDRGFATEAPRTQRCAELPL